MKTYTKPAIKVRKIESESILAASDPIGSSVYDSQADSGAQGLSKDNSFFYSGESSRQSIDWDEEE